jgi:nicotinate-nucleotide--dimethylbenzimidazole phosphoribosyltransferase
MSSERFGRPIKILEGEAPVSEGQNPGDRKCIVQKVDLVMPGNIASYRSNDAERRVGPLHFPRVQPLDRAAEADIRARIEGKAKPPGSLGRIETLAMQLALIAAPAAPSIKKPLLMVFAGDHGLVAEGVSSYSSAVTAAMVNTFLAGRATANAFASACGVAIKVVDAGVAADLPPHAHLIAAKIRKGTSNAALGPAMTLEEADAAISTGAQLAQAQIGGGCDLIVLGEMGIGNTAASALIVHRLAPASLPDCIGIGAGQSELGLARKRAAVETAASRSEATLPREVLAQFGGFEIAMMTGAILGAAYMRTPVVIDGFICSAAALAAIRIDPAARDYCVFAHRSAERGHDIVLSSLEVSPVLDLGLRLGEGTGALLCVPLLRAAANMLTQVASLDDVMAGRI